MSVAHPRTLIDKLRLLLGFAILPVVNVLLAFLLHPVLWSDGPYQGAQWGDPVDAALSFASGVGIVSFIVTATGVVPTVTWLLRRGRPSLRQLLVAGVAIGNVPFALAAAGVVLFYLAGRATSADVSYTLWSGPIGAVRAVALGSGMGAASAIIFWVVAILGADYGRQLSVD